VKGEKLRSVDGTFPAAEGRAAVARHPVSVLLLVLLLHALPAQAAGAPVVHRTYVTGVGTTGADLNAYIDPLGAETTYGFEYGPADCSANPCAGVPGSEADMGTAAAVVTEHLGGLQPDTTYHYRVIATNADGTTPGPDRWLRTFAPPDPDHGLPENRAYEMVSPPDKNGGGIMANAFRTRSNLSGNAITFTSLIAFGDAHGTGISGTEYLARRGSDGWTTHGITPAGNAPASVSQLWASFYGISPELARGVFLAIPESPIVPGHPNSERSANLYLRTDLDVPGEGAWQLLSDGAEPLVPEGLFGPGIALAGGNSGTPGSPAYSHIIFESTDNLTGETTGTKPKLYEWDEGTLRVAGVLPDDVCETPPCFPGANAGSVAGMGAGGTLGQIASVTGVGYTDRAISDDGSRIFFTAGPLTIAPISWGVSSGSRGLVGSGVYMRVNGSETVKLNESERTEPDAPQPAQWGGASADGSRVLLLTKEKLTDTDPNAAVDLYMYDVDAPAGEHLTLLSVDQQPEDSEHPAIGVAAVSEDGQYVYFVGTEALMPGQIPDPFTQRRILYVWHDGTIRLVGISHYSDFGGDDESWLQFPIAKAKAVRTTPDGRHAVVWSLSDFGQIGYDNELAGDAELGHRCNNNSPCVEVYAYSYPEDELRCVSCPSTNVVPKGNSSPAEEDPSTSGKVRIRTHYLNRAVNEQGTRVFFSSPDRLVPEDVNALYDAYMYDLEEDRVHLISTGQCFCDSFFVEASPSGDDVFFTTREQLVGIDTDGAVDLYDARVRGGIAAQNPPEPFECQGDACLGPVTPRDEPSPASATFVGPEDPKPRFRRARRCRRVKGAGRRGMARADRKRARPCRSPRKRHRGRNR
jgi:hypothetical protein